jgi:hypothetical protein
VPHRGPLKPKRPVFGSSAHRPTAERDSTPPARRAIDGLRSAHLMMPNAERHRRMDHEGTYPCRGPMAVESARAP